MHARDKDPDMAQLDFVDAYKERSEDNDLIFDGQLTALMQPYNKDKSHIEKPISPDQFPCLTITLEDYASSQLGPVSTRTTWCWLLHLDGHACLAARPRGSERGRTL